MSLNETQKKYNETVEKQVEEGQKEVELLLNNKKEEFANELITLMESFGIKRIKMRVVLSCAYHKITKELKD